MSRPLSDPDAPRDSEFDRLWDSSESHTDGTHPLAQALRGRQHPADESRERARLGVPPRRSSDDASIQEKFERFHKTNPHVYATLVRLARQYRARVGVTPGIGMLWEVMRWQLAMETRTDGAFKLNNDYRSRYARRIMQGEADLADAFETRQLKAA